ncbi:hypothetical protein ACFL27_16040 [candidate division CSSED10-310 bacterium]|uniref:Uncharacterized protein n=1 Tax=candidate division CSSED10-310 bacterium TaxID=2855610 RepID=A0ABV6Z048_UNCC1
MSYSFIMGSVKNIKLRAVPRPYVILYLYFGKIIKGITSRGINVTFVAMPKPETTEKQIVKTQSGANFPRYLECEK